MVSTYACPFTHVGVSSQLAFDKKRVTMELGLFILYIRKTKKNQHEFIGEEYQGCFWSKVMWRRSKPV